MSDAPARNARRALATTPAADLSRAARIAAAVLGSIAGLMLVLSPASAAGQAAAASVPRVLVMPFENAGPDQRAFWLGEAAALLITDALQLRGAAAIGRDERREAFARLQIPPTVPLTDATVIRIARMLGATEVVVGSVQLEDDSLSTHTRVIDLESGTVGAGVDERGPVGELGSVFGRIAARIASPAAQGVVGEAAGEPAAAALEQYVKGVLAETPAVAIQYLTRALEIEPSLTRARLRLWDVHTEQGNHAAALQAVETGDDAPDSARARFRMGISQLRLGRLDDAFKTYAALADTQPAASVMNNLGVVQLRRAGEEKFGQPNYYFYRAVSADGADPDYFFNLGYAYFQIRNMSAAIYWLREGLRRDPADADAHAILASALAADGQGAEAAKERELAQRLLGAPGRQGPGEAAAGLERVKTELEEPGRPRPELPAADAAADPGPLVDASVERARTLFSEARDWDALEELLRAQYLAPYDAVVHLLAARIHLRNGRLAQAIDALKLSLWSVDSAEGHLLLAQAYLDSRDPAAARDEIRRTLTLDPTSTDARQLLDRIDGRRAPPVSR